MGRSYRTSRAKREPFDFTLDAELDGDGHEIDGTGLRFVCVAEGVSLLDLSELASVADADVESPEGAAAIARIFRAALGDDYRRFREHMAKHPDVEVVFAILQDLIAYYTAGPTRRPSPSSRGPLATNGGSPDSSPSGVIEGRWTVPDDRWPGLLSDEELAGIRSKLGRGG